WVAGSLRLRVPAGASTCTYHVGDSSNYRKMDVTFPASTTTGDLTGKVSQNSGEHGSISDPSFQIDAAHDANRFWTLTTVSMGLGGGSYTATFTFVVGDLDSGVDTSQFEASVWNGSSWSLTTPGTRTSTTTQAGGMTLFGDYAVGQRKVSASQSTVI